MLLLVIVLKAVVEIVALTMLGQGILWVLAGAARERNVIYRAFALVTGPLNRSVRAITPRFIADAHVPLLSFFLLCVLWVLLVAAKIALVVSAR